MLLKLILKKDKKNKKSAMSYLTHADWQTLILCARMSSQTADAVLLGHILSFISHVYN